MSMVIEDILATLSCRIADRKTDCVTHQESVISFLRQLAEEATNAAEEISDSDAYDLDSVYITVVTEEMGKVDQFARLWCESLAKLHEAQRTRNVVTKIVKAEEAG